MLGEKGGRAQNVKSCSKTEDDSREDLSTMSWWKDWKKKKNGSQLNSVGHRVKLQVPPIGVEG